MGELRQFLQQAPGEDGLQCERIPTGMGEQLPRQVAARSAAD